MGAQGKTGRDRPIATGLAADRPAANLITPDSFYFATDTGVLSWSDGATWTTVSPAPVASELAGYEYSHVAFTGNVSVTATSEATANTIVTAGAVAFDGAIVALIEFWCSLARSANSTSMQYFLYDGSSSIGILGQTDTDAAGNGHPVKLERRLTPSNASHTYSIRAKVVSGTGTVFAGAGGTAALVPGFIRITRAA